MDTLKLAAGQNNSQPLELALSLAAGQRARLGAMIAGLMRTI